MTEAQIQSKIKTSLERAGWFVTKLIQTSTNGIPDLLALRESKAVFIECKRPGLKPSPLQAYRMDQIEKKGFETIIATTIKDIDHLL